jgi:hypothetical protein
MGVAEYEEIEVDKITQLLGKRALVQWEEAPKSLAKSGALAGLVRPDTTGKAYFTGVVLRCGLDLTEEVTEGDRIFFQQFSGFQKFSDPKHGRVAIIDEGAIEAVIPPREDGAYPLVEDGGVYR